MPFRFQRQYRHLVRGFLAEVTVLVAFLVALSALALAVAAIAGG